MRGVLCFYPVFTQTKQGREVDWDLFLFGNLKISEGYQSLTLQAFVYQQVDVPNMRVIKREPNKTLSK